MQLTFGIGLPSQSGRLQPQSSGAYVDPLQKLHQGAKENRRIAENAAKSLRLALLQHIAPEQSYALVKKYEEALKAYESRSLSQKVLQKLMQKIDEKEQSAALEALTAASEEIDQVLSQNGIEGIQVAPRKPDGNKPLLYQVVVLITNPILARRLTADFEGIWDRAILNFYTPV